MESKCPCPHCPYPDGASFDDAGEHFKTDFVTITGLLMHKQALAELMLADASLKAFEDYCGKTADMNDQIKKEFARGKSGK